MKLTLSISAAFHVLLVALLFLVPMAVTVSPPKIDLSNAVEVVFAPPPAPPAPPQPEPPPPQLVAGLPPPSEPSPPPPPPPVVEQPLPPPAPVAETPAPPPKPVAETPVPTPKPEAKPEPKPVAKPRPRPPVQPAQQEMPQLPLPLPLPLPRPNPSTATAQQMAAIPPPAAPTVSADYRTLLSGWLESHKRYPDDARQRGEEGRAVLRFRVDRFGRVIDYAVVSSTGFADLDRAVENMMRGATMPPFPPSMPQPEIEVSVTIRFGLAR